jgi:hypothetical protein
MASNFGVRDGLGGEGAPSSIAKRMCCAKLWSDGGRSARFRVFDQMSYRAIRLADFGSTLLASTAGPILSHSFRKVRAFLGPHGFSSFERPTRSLPSMLRA